MVETIWMSGAEAEKLLGRSKLSGMSAYFRGTIGTLWIEEGGVYFLSDERVLDGAKPFSNEHKKWGYRYSYALGGVLDKDLRVKVTSDDPGFVVESDPEPENPLALKTYFENGEIDQYDFEGAKAQCSKFGDKGELTYYAGRLYFINDSLYWNSSYIAKRKNYKHSWVLKTVDDCGTLELMESPKLKHQPSVVDEAHSHSYGHRLSSDVAIDTRSGGGMQYQTEKEETNSMRRFVEDEVVIKLNQSL